jgi:long-chain fatty acid transport protein
MIKQHRITPSSLAATIAITLAPPLCFGAGFQLNEYSSAGLGRAFSGEGAIADNATSGSRNPATMTMFDRPSFSAGAIYIAPQINIYGQSPVTGHNTDGKNIAPSEWIPNVHFIMPINDRWSWGASVTSNYGLATQYSENYPAGLAGGKTNLTTINNNLSAAYRINDHLSVGFGVDAVYAKAEIERTMGEVGPLISSGLISPSTDAAYIKDNQWGYGWNSGLLYQLDANNRFGFTYRSSVNIDFNGTYHSDLPSNLGGTNGQGIASELPVKLPAIWEFSAYHRIAPQWAIHYSATYTQWSQFKALQAKTLNGVSLFDKQENFHDAWRLALGTTYYFDKNWTFRSGIAFDNSPIPDQYRSLAIPDQDRIWLSAGSTYAINNNTSIDFGIAYMHGKTVTINETLTSNLPEYSFTAKGSALLYGININHQF